MRELRRPGGSSQPCVLHPSHLSTPSATAAGASRAANQGPAAARAGGGRQPAAGRGDRRGHGRWPRDGRAAARQRQRRGAHPGRLRRLCVCHGCVHERTAAAPAVRAPLLCGSRRRGTRAGCLTPLAAPRSQAPGPRTCAPGCRAPCPMCRASRCIPLCWPTRSSAPPRMRCSWRTAAQTERAWSQRYTLGHMGRCGCLGGWRFFSRMCCHRWHSRSGLPCPNPVLASLPLQVYVCGVSDDNVPVPPSAADVQPRPEAIRTLQGVAASVSRARAGLHAGAGRDTVPEAHYGPSSAAADVRMMPCLLPLPAWPQELGAAELLQQQACYLPCTDDGMPLIGRLPGLENAYLATGATWASGPAMPPHAHAWAGAACVDRWCQLAAVLTPCSRPRPAPSQATAAGASSMRPPRGRRWPS